MNTNIREAAEVERRAVSANNDWLLHEVERLQGLLRGISRDLAAEVEQLTCERNEALAEVEQLHRAHQAACEGGDLLRAEVERLHEERDTLLLDAYDFLRWFNQHHPDPSSNPYHPWCAISDRLNAYADTLATFDSGVETK